MVQAVSTSSLVGAGGSGATDVRAGGREAFAKSDSAIPGSESPGGNHVRRTTARTVRSRTGFSASVASVARVIRVSEIDECVVLRIGVLALRDELRAGQQLAVAQDQGDAEGHERGAHHSRGAEDCTSTAVNPPQSAE